MKIKFSLSWPFVLQLSLSSLLILSCIIFPVLWIFVPSLTKLLLTWFSAINVWIHFGVFDKNAKPSAVDHFQEDLGFVHGRDAISWSGSGRALPAVEVVPLWGQQICSKMSLVLPVRCCSLSSMVFYL